MSSQSQRFFCEILNAEQKISLPLLSSTDYIPKNVLEQKVLVHRVTLLNVIIVYHCFSSRNYYCFCACFNLIINYRKKTPENNLEKTLQKQVFYDSIQSAMYKHKTKYKVYKAISGTCCTLQEILFDFQDSRSMSIPPKF